MNNKQTPIEKAIDLIDGFLTQLDDIAENNNKQTMKLYTEEQLHTVMLLALGRHGLYSDKKQNQDLIDLITPIELPSDEEIYIEAQVKKDNIKLLPFDAASFQFGALWLRDKIQGVNQ